MKKILLVISLCFILTGCGNYAELDKLAIVTGVAIDKDGDDYEISYLVANSPKGQTSSKEGEAKTTVYSGTGETIPDAAMIIEQKSPKKIYLGHVNVVIISEEIAKDGFFKVADWLFRNPETRKQFYLLLAKDEKAKNIIKIISPLESFPSQSIATLLESNRNSISASTTTTYNNFVGYVLEQGADPIVPTITIKGDVKEGSDQSNIETTEPTAYLALGPLAIFKEDKLVGYVKAKESELINLIQNKIKEIKYTLNYNDDDITIDSYNLKTKLSLKDEWHVNLTITGTGNIYNINSDINISDPKEIRKIEKKWNKFLQKSLKKLIKKMQNEYKSDIFGFGNKIYSTYPQKWNQVKDEWNDKYFKQVKVTINSNLKIPDTGSLKNTLTEARK